MPAQSQSLILAECAPNRAETLQQYALAFLLAAICLLLMQQFAYANEDTPMGDTLCTIAGFIYGNMGRGLATIAIIVLGVGATLGKTSWGLAMTVAIGISVIFNAHVIVGLLVPSAAVCTNLF